MAKFERVMDFSDLADLWAKAIEWVSLLTGRSRTAQFKVSIKPYRDTRSNRQMRYYWGWLVGSVVDWATSRWYGWEPEDAHAWLKSHFFVDIGEFEESIRLLIDWKITPQDLLFDATKLISEATTTDLDTKEFTEKIEEIRDYFRAKYKWTIPLPDEAPLPTEPWKPLS